EEMKSYSGHVPEMVIREGKRPEQVLTLIEQDREIGVLVLGSGSEGEGPGPLVTHVVTKMAGRMPIPVTVVPGQLSMDEIDSVC
ncbi:MAG: universal stress protein, partial [Pseudomonadota bacterium]